MNQRIVFFLTSLILAVSAFSQATGGFSGISGIVRDPSGAVVPGAQVVISNESRGVRLTLTTSEGGVFSAPPLVPSGGYDVTVTKSGFSVYEVKDLELRVGQNLNLDVSLTVASTTSEIRVEAAAPLVDELKTDVSQVINSQQILDLPINGRRVDSFVLLTPGVTNDGNFGLLTFRGVANGNNFLLDGNDTTEEYYVENNGRTRITSQISQDAVQEFQVVSANFSAEYGRASGGVVNTVTRSGSNDLHGTGYWFFRNQNFIAHDPYANVNPDEWRLQSGASVGGRIIKDKLFYFFNAEFTRRNAPLVDSIVRAGVVDSANQTWIGCGAPATPAQCAAIDKLLPRFFGSLPRTVTQDLGFGRLDYRYSERNTFSASLNFMHFKSPNGLQQTLVASTSGSGINSNGDDYGRVRNGKFTWTGIPKSNMVNEFRFGWSTDLEGDNINPDLIGPALGPLAVTVASQSIGSYNLLPRVQPREERFEFADNFSWVKGRHIVKFGTDIATVEDYSYFIQNANGSYTYQTPTNFALDYSGNAAGAKNWQTYAQAFGDPTVDARINAYSFYLQDEWRPFRNFTATIGGRYEYEQLPQPTKCNQDFPQTCHIYSKPTNVMPRIGLAYSLNNKTVIRAGYGLFYARVSGSTVTNMFTGNGVTTTSISLSGTQAPQKVAGPVFPNILSAVPTGISLSAANIQFADPNLKTPYSEQGTFAIERELTRDLGLTVSYIWSRGVQLYSVRDLNLPTATTPFTYTIADASGNPSGSTYTVPVLIGSRPDKRYGSINQDENGVTSSYNALAVQLNKRFSYGLQAALSYTWSHEIDDGQSFGQSNANTFLNNAFDWLENGNYKADRGNGLEDQRHRFVLSWIWAPTFTRSTGFLSKYLVNNWQLSSITTINSSRPYGSPTVRLLDTPVSGMFSNFTLNGSGLGTRVPFWAVNSVYQPALYKSDARLSKILPLGERYKLALNFEAFNISNSWSPTSMSKQAFTESKGVLTLTPTAYNQGLGDAATPDGTLARRLQVSARFSF
jgi:Carboxypeptidase regulatory-like domain/TonB dependent receptor/TonB-dependent Receptor Plug Domain